MELLNLLKELVSFDTTIGVKKKPSKDCPKFIRDYLEDRGVSCEILEEKGYYTVHGEIGRGRPIVALLSHFDTVPFNQEEWKSHPLELRVDGNRAYGRGSLDDKSNVASIMTALESMEPKKGRVVFAFTGDEEIGGKMGALKWADYLKEEGLWPDYLINGDGYGMFPIIRRRGVFGVRITVPSDKRKVKGLEVEFDFSLRCPISKTGHAAQFLPGVDEHPLIALSQEVRLRGILLSNIDGNFVKSNVLPSRVKARGVIPKGDSGEEIEVNLGLTELVKSIVPLTRIPLKPEKYSDFGINITPNVLEVKEKSIELLLDVRIMSRELSKEEFEEVLRSNLREYSLRISGKSGYLYTPENSKLVLECLKVLRDLGEESSPGEGAGASDSRYFSPEVEAIDIGPRGGGAHSSEEYVEIDSLEKMPTLYSRLVKSLLGGG